LSPLILAEHDSPRFIRLCGMWLQATHLYPWCLSEHDWHNFCLLSCSGSCSLPCCVQPGYVGTCLGMGRARTWYRGQGRPPIAPACICHGPSGDWASMG